MGEEPWDAFGAALAKALTEDRVLLRVITERVALAKVAISYSVSIKHIHNALFCHTEIVIQTRGRDQNRKEGLAADKRRVSGGINRHGIGNERAVANATCDGQLYLSLHLGGGWGQAAESISGMNLRLTEPVLL